MQFDPIDTTCKQLERQLLDTQLISIGTLATACTWCVVEVACGTIALCLPTLRPLMLMVSSKFESVGSRNATGKSKIPTELVTIGGTGGKTGAFQRINDEYEPNSSQKGLAMRGESAPHGDQSDQDSETHSHEGKIDVGR
ncbi:hypothetical protein NW766_011005 [Fusarium irregulare]|uniref:Uncharacterized protein n=1 Tax=Fusarium irregulare TaxID=2494466 RepID=A0A9W8U5Z2_9HYPO|nr:hypothetical protein NW766_011005 [Fusarium irregulare]